MILLLIRDLSCLVAAVQIGDQICSFFDAFQTRIAHDVSREELVGPAEEEKHVAISPDEIGPSECPTVRIGSSSSLLIHDIVKRRCLKRSSIALNHQALIQTKNGSLHITNCIQFFLVWRFLWG